MGRKKGMHGQTFKIDQGVTIPLKESSAPSDWLRSCRALWNRLLGKTGPKMSQSKCPFLWATLTKEAAKQKR